MGNDRRRHVDALGRKEPVEQKSLQQDGKSEAVVGFANRVDQGKLMGQQGKSLDQPIKIPMALHADSLAMQTATNTARSIGESGRSLGTTGGDEINHNSVLALTNSYRWTLLKSCRPAVCCSAWVRKNPPQEAGMTTRGSRTTMTERLTIRALANEGQTDGEIAAHLQRSRWTIRKWRRRGAAGTLTPLHSQFGRPARGPLATFPQQLVAAIRQLRVDHPGWGATTILVELHRLPQWADTPLPSCARIGAFLRAEGLTRPPPPATTLPEPPRPPDPAPHEIWQLDAKGCTRLPHLGLVSLINIVDQGSRVKVESMPATRWAPGLKDYQLALRRAFVQWGLPEAVTFDRGTVFFDNTTASPFPTRIHLWLIALGVQVAFCRPRRPTDHAMVERYHQTIDRHGLWGQTWTELQALWRALDTRREVLNTAYPSRPCGTQAPLADIPAAVHSGRPYRPEWEEDLLDLQRVGAYLAGAYWIRQGSTNGQIGLGGEKYWIGPAIEGKTLHITFDPAAWQFVLRPIGKPETITFRPRGLSKAALLGDLTMFLRLPSYQLALPYDADTWRGQAYDSLLHPKTRCQSFSEKNCQ